MPSRLLRLRGIEIAPMCISVSFPAIHGPASPWVPRDAIKGRRSVRQQLQPLIQVKRHRVREMESNADGGQSCRSCYR